jgi:N-acetylmuramoyl-L-alanine amidase
VNFAKWIALLATAIGSSAAISSGQFADAGPRAIDGRADAGALAGITVAVDPGHNRGNSQHADEINKLVDAGTLKKACDTTGTAEPGGISEAQLTMRVARTLQRKLEAMGATVILTHTEGKPAWGPCITKRAAIGNKADISISVHADGSLAKGARGFHVIRPKKVDGLTDDIYVDSRRFAKLVRNAVHRRTDLPYSTYIGNDGIDVRSDLGGLNLSDVPKVFLEMGNMHNTRDMKILDSKRGQGQVATAMANAIRTFMLSNSTT